MSASYSVEWRPTALKELKHLDGPIRARISRKVTDLATNPRPSGVVKLTGPNNLWRIRIGDYRVVYTIEDDRLVVTVVRVAGRGQVCRAL